MSAPAVPNSASGSASALTAIAEPATAAATPTVTRISTRSCWRHFRRNKRHVPAQDCSGDQRMRFARPFMTAGPACNGAAGLGPVGARFDDDAPVAQEDDAVSPRRELRAVGHDDAGRAAAADVASDA